MRLLLSSLALAAGCAAAGVPAPGGGGGDDGNSPHDAFVVDVGIDACLDDDHDTVCNAQDKCAGHDDRLDADNDMVADGCDRCPGQDDKPDVNMNGVPDCAELMTRTINVKIVGANYWRGWYSDMVAHTTANDNTVTGVVSAATYHSYFVFSLAGFTATSIASVTMELELESYVSGDANETLSAWDVTTPSSTVEPDGNSAAIYADLGAGNTYGTATVTAGSVSASTPVQFVLNAQAATDLKAKLGGELVVGVKLDNPPGYVRFSGAQEARIARLQIKYLP